MPILFYKRYLIPNLLKNDIVFVSNVIKMFAVFFFPERKETEERA